MRDKLILMVLTVYIVNSLLAMGELGIQITQVTRILNVHIFSTTSHYVYMNHLSICICIHSSIHLPTHPSIHPSIHSFIHPSIPKMAKISCQTTTPAKLTNKKHIRMIQILLHQRLLP